MIRTKLSPSLTRGVKGWLIDWAVMGGVWLTFVALLYWVK